LKNRLYIKVIFSFSKNIQNLFGPTHPPVQWIKVKVKVKFTLEQTTKSQKGRRGLDLLFFNLGARCGGRSTPRSGCFTPGKDPVPIV
jgi:hypothetical protein